MTQVRTFAPSLWIFALAAGALALAPVAGCVQGAIGDPPGAEVDGGGVVDARPDADPGGCQGMPVESWYADADGDTFGDATDVIQACEEVPGYVRNGDDCDDTRGGVNPDAAEICGDYLDNDCAGGDLCVASMVAHWRFDEDQGGTAQDSTERGHAGALVGGPTWTGTGLAFDGVDDYVEVAHAGDMRLREGTIALWFRTDDAKRSQGLWSKDHNGFGTGGHLSIYLNYNATDDILALVGRLQDTAASHTVNKGGIVANRWYHVVVSFGTNGMSLRLDGQLEDSDTYAGGMEESSGGTGNVEPLVIGANNANSEPGSTLPMTNPLVGQIHDVQVYDRPLLAKEITELYQVYKP